ncbi:MAG: ABC transporter ATP-binding protein [Butyricicoccus sp.]
MNDMITLHNLTKKFGEFTAVDGLNLQIETGEFFGLLGPNGAGKTTTISLLSTLLLPTSGEVLIDGQKLTRKTPSLKRKISVITQEYSMRQDMTMDEVMEYQGRLYFMPRKKIKERSEELLDFCDLLRFRKRTVRKLSGGMKRKLMVCRALLTEPEILLLDEPTAGMDALSRRQMWNLLRQLNQNNLTILLTTHYMEEAETLCNRVALMHQGHLEEVNTPQAMIDALGPLTVDEVTDNGVRSRHFATREQAIAFLSSCDGQTTLRNTTLEDVFVSRAGKHLTQQ